MYVQQIEGDAWKGGKFDKAKLDKMSGRINILDGNLSSFNFAQMNKSPKCMSSCKRSGRKRAKRQAEL
jgi:hypothetical protein